MPWSIFSLNPTACAIPKKQHPKNPLDGGLVGDRSNVLWLVVLGADGASLTWLRWLSLQVDVLASLLGVSLLSSVGLDTGQELVTRTRVLDVLDTDVDALLDVAVADLAVEDDTDGGLGDVVDNTSLSVVDLVWLLNAGVSLSPQGGACSVSLESQNTEATKLICVSKYSSTYHALLNSSVGDDIDDISDLVLLEVRAERNHTLLLEVAREGCFHHMSVSFCRIAPVLFHIDTSAAHTIASASAETCSVTHLVGVVGGRV